MQRGEPSITCDNGSKWKPAQHQSDHDPLQVSRAVLKLLDEHLPDVYSNVEHHAEYPNQDDCDSPDEYDMEVDRAEIRALVEILQNEIEAGG
jgi:hypothetical protein